MSRITETYFDLTINGTVRHGVLRQEAHGNNVHTTLTLDGKELEESSGTKDCFHALDEMSEPEAAAWARDYCVETILTAWDYAEEEKEAA